MRITPALHFDGTFVPTKSKKMRTDQIILSSFSLAELQSLISETFQKEFSKVSTKDSIPDGDFITRQETAKILGITLATLHQWTLREIVQGYRIGTRVRYKKNEILNSLIGMNSLKYGGLKK